MHHNVFSSIGAKMRTFNLSFANKLFISLLLFAVMLLVIMHGYFWNVITHQLQEQIGGKALSQAETIASMSSLKEAVLTKDISRVQLIIDPLSQKSDASFIVIGDQNANRLYHSLHGEIGQHMIGGDSETVLQGNPIISISKGSFGVSLRGKAPIYGANNQVIGIVSVGYFQKQIDQYSMDSLLPLLVFCGLLFIALFIFSFLFTRSIKHQMLELEPKEIGLLFSLQKSILESIYEGVIAIDKQHKIIHINVAARLILHLDLAEQQLINRPLDNYLKPIPFLYGRQNSDKDEHDQLCDFNKTLVIASRVRIIIANNIEGWVITFRDKDDINTLTAKLTQIRKYADNLRVIRHEHLNQMTTLSGLLTLQRYTEALQLINKHSELHQEALDFITRHFNNPTLCGLLLGKTATARELGITLQFDPQSQLMTLPSLISEAEFISIVGNIIDNAINAMLQEPLQNRKIEVFLSDATDEYLLEVADWGCGIDESIKETLFELGVTTHTEPEHGIGLYLVYNYVKKANGYISIEPNEPKGTIVSIYIPK